MIDLVITHLTHPWGPPWTLETFGDHWRPLATLGDMLENDHLGGNWKFVISWSITLKIELWAPHTHWHAMLKGEVYLRQKAKSKFGFQNLIWRLGFWKRL